MYNEVDKKEKQQVAWAPAVLRTALAHESANSSTGTRGDKVPKGNAILLGNKEKDFL